MFKENPRPTLLSNGTVDYAIKTLAERYEHHLEKLKYVGLVRDNALHCIDGKERPYMSAKEVVEAFTENSALAAQFRQRLILLERASDGLPDVVPDVEPHSFYGQFQIGFQQDKKVGIGGSTTQDLSSDISGNLVAIRSPSGVFGGSRVLDRNATKLNRLQAGEFGYEKLGPVFMDAGVFPPIASTILDAYQAHNFCQKYDLSLVDLGNRHVLELLRRMNGQQTGDLRRSWVNACLLRQSKDYFVRASWNQESSILFLGAGECRNTFQLGAFRSFRITGQDPR